MEIFVLTSTFKPLLMLNSVISLEYTERFQDAGKISLEIPIDENVIRLIAPGVRLIVDSLAFTVELVRIQNGSILITGVGIFAEFEHIYVSNPRVSYATPNAYALELAGGLELEGVNYSVYGLSGNYETIEVYDYATSYASVLRRLFAEYDLGYKMYYNVDAGELQFHLRAKVDKAYVASTRVIMSDTREDYELLEYENDASRYKNYIELLQWYPITKTLITCTYDRSGGEAKRGLSVAMSVPAETEAELQIAFNTRALELFEEHKRLVSFRVKPLRELGLSLGDICRLECMELGESLGALFKERTVRFSATGCDEAYLLEGDI